MDNINIEKIKDLIGNPVIRKIALTILVIIIAIFFCVFNNRNNDGYIIEEVDVNKEIKDTYSKDIYVDIDGCVLNPGVYKVEEGTRLFEVLEMAGGVTLDGDVTNINRAKEVKDGEKIIIPKFGIEITDGGLININLADSSKLEELPGIGPVTAQMIIDYRNEYNGFDKIEDILNIKGIGTATYNKIKEEITV